MEFVGSIIDFGTAPETSVDGIARITRVSEHKVRVSYFARHIGPNGQEENRIVQHVDWDFDVWTRCLVKKQMAIENLVHEAEAASPGSVVIAVPLH